MLKRSKLKKVLKKIRSISTFWIAKHTITHLKTIRKYEFNVILKWLPPDGRLLDVGSGIGWQAEGFKNRGYDVSAIDIASSNYHEHRVWPIIDYDGENIPFENNTFDIIFSSHVLMHIPHLDRFQTEMHRVLKPDGCVLHMLPSSSWRFWTNITHVLKSWTIPQALGVHAKNSVVEIYYFSHQKWFQLFKESGWEIVHKDSNKLFYTGNCIMGSQLKIGMRKKMSNFMGSSCNIFILKKASVTLSIMWRFGYQPSAFSYQEEIFFQLFSL